MVKIEVGDISCNGQLKIENNLTVNNDIITKGKLTIGKDFFKLKTNLSNSILIADGGKI